MNNEKENETKSDELDQLILDRLVDNDLSDQEYREVLRLVEEKPDGWRKLALAFLESQAFENELSELNQFPALVETEFTQQETTQNNSSQLSSNRDGKANHSTKPPSPVSRVERDSGFWKSVRGAIPALAACLAIAFAVGLYVREIQNRNQLKTADSGDFVGSDTDPDYIELVSNDPDGRVQTPVYNHQNFDAGDYAQDVKALKPRLQEVVNRSGWNADERTHMVPIKDRTGNRIIVPLNEIKLTPNSFDKYQ